MSDETLLWLIEKLEEDLGYASSRAIFNPTDTLHAIADARGKIAAIKKLIKDSPVKKSNSQPDKRPRDKG